ncbi:MAG: CehA/McbA family metallohydrolase, partial [Pseudomonadota bacterium]|nr:CehA/McbA family metallohydrolase [Pseudomonadota bacterium]
MRNTHGVVWPWPSDNRYFFYVDGEYDADIPAGEYTLVISKGPEYRQVVQSLSIKSGAVARIETHLQRWVDMPERGWFSGDDHVHMARTPNDNASISAVMQAEDVHVTNVLQMGNPFDTHFHQYAFGKNGRYRMGDHALVPGVEDPRTAVRGHTISMNIEAVFRPADSYLRYDQIFAEYRSQGGLSGFAHVAGRLFNVERGLAIDVPLGAVDFVEVLQDGALETELWYDFLNLGFKLIPTAGSDFPYLGAPGSDRNYVYVGDDFTVDAYFEALREQQTFVSTGPILDFTVNDQLMGADISAAPGDLLDIKASASLNPDIGLLDRIE